MNIYYTGVGARVTPNDVLERMFDYAKVLENIGYILRSGGQPKGADGAFENGVIKAINKNIYKPRCWQSSGNTPTIKDEAYEIAARHHPAWNNLKPFAKDLMARNVHAVLGDDLNNPSEFLICWTIDGMNNVKPRTRVSGGTGHTLSIANEARVQIFNLQNIEDEKNLDMYIWNKLKER